MTLYLDTSSLVKLYVSEAGSDAVRTLMDEAEVVATCALAYPETRAALARRRRERLLRPAGFASAKRAFDEDWPKYLVVDVTSALCRQAGDLAERYRLRAYDSVHLAAFADLARAAGPGDAHFSSFDATQNRAAQALRRALIRGR